MVRPTSDIWALFDVTKTNNKSIAVCKYCRLKYSFPNATRMTAHIKKCIKCPKDIKSKFQIDESAKSSTLSVQQLPQLSLANKSQTSTATVRTVSESSIGTFGTGEEWEDTSISVASSSSILEIEPSPFTSPILVHNKQKSSTSTPTSTMSIMSRFVDNITQNESDKIDELLARALYATSAPLSFLDNPYWKKAFKTIRPAYSLPSTYMFSNTLLNAEYERVRRASEVKINEASSLTLSSDGWTNIRGEGVVNFIVCTPSPIFYKSIQPGTERETGQFISDQMIHVIDELGNGKFVLVVTDNASNMKAAWEIVEKKYPHISCAGCAAHSLNLLLKDFMQVKTFTKTSAHCRNICRYIKKHHVIYAGFKKVQSEKYKKNKIITLKIPGKTRWGSIVITLRSLLKNKEALQNTVLIEELQIKQNIKRRILDDNFWANIQTTLDIFTPISTAIKIIESDKALMSEVPKIFDFIKKRLDQIWQNLQPSQSSRDLKNKLLKYVEERFEFCCKPIHFAANLLDPRFRGSHLTEDEITLAIDFITEKANCLKLDTPKLIANLAHYRTKTGFFSRNSIWESSKYTHPVVWWQGLCTTQPLSPLSSRILNGIPSSAACERNWSAHGNVHTAIRNRLSGQRVEKLVAVQCNLKFCETTEESEDYYEYTPRPYPLIKGEDGDEEDEIEVIQEQYQDDDEEEEEELISSGEDESNNEEDDLPLSVIASRLQ